MDNLGQVTLSTVSLFGHTFQINPMTFYMTWIVMGLTVLLAYLSTLNLRVIPNSVQNLCEVIFEFVEELTLGTLGKKEGRRFLPFIFTIFIFTLLANWIGIVPNVAKLLGSVIAMLHTLFGGAASVAFEGFTNIQVSPAPQSWYSFLFKVPDLQEPTRSVNTDLAMALMVFIVVHFNSLFKKGPIEYLKQYWGDVIPCHGWWLLLAPINIMIPLNLIGEVSSVVSHSFRLFGNIFGGFMIVTIVSSLIKFFVIPIGLLAFFGLFAGLVQAFVFTMLAITYIGQKA